jgi:hypothetical protein
MFLLPSPEAFDELREQNSFEAALTPAMGGLTTGMLALSYPEILYQVGGRYRQYLQHQRHRPNQQLSGSAEETQHAWAGAEPTSPGPQKEICSLPCGQGAHWLSAGTHRHPSARPFSSDTKSQAFPSKPARTPHPAPRRALTT